MSERTYLAIDLKSFYASAECVARGLDPLDANLVVADVSRTSKTICLAVSPSLKAYGIGGRARLFEVEQRVGQVNEERRLRAPNHRLVGSSTSAARLHDDPLLSVDFIAAKPRMAYYLRMSAKIYGIYLKYASQEDIHVYSVDEVFIDATRYLKYFGCSAHELARRIIADIKAQTGITATGGIGTNMYLAKVAMDIVAKHIPADEDGVRIAQLDESSYRRTLWSHQPLTDFWRVGRSIARTLETHGMLTMGDVARCSLGSASDYYNENLLYRLFGVNAELLIDHAWGWEPCTIADIKAYRPEHASLSSGQVLMEPYDHARARVVVLEMADQLAYDMMKQNLVAEQVALAIGYDSSAGTAYNGPLAKDYYGRTQPKSAHSSAHLGSWTSSTRIIRDTFGKLFDKIANPELYVRRITVGTVDSKEVGEVRGEQYEQLDLFEQTENEDAGECGAEGGERAAMQENAVQEEKDLAVQRALIDVKTRFGGNAILTGTNLEEGATGRQRNKQIGGHAA